jgi:hypothetical protein
MLSRRSFLGLAGGVVALAACGSDSGDSSAPRTSGVTLPHDHDELTELAPAVVSSDLYATPEPQRFAFAMLAKEGYASLGSARVAVAPEGSEPRDFVDTTLHAEGLPERRGVFVTDLVLDRPGIWDGVAERDGERLPFAFQVKDAPQAPAVGTLAPRAPSPTEGDPLGVDPICTRAQPCGLHAASLDTVIGAGTPTAVLFATPARCTTQYCGPVLDALLPLAAEYADRVRTVHVEIYRNDRTDEVVPTVAAWGLPSEPWLFGVSADGTITHRLDGAFGRDEIRAVLEALAAG